LGKKKHQLCCKHNLDKIEILGVNPRIYNALRKIGKDELQQATDKNPDKELKNKRPVFVQVIEQKTPIEGGRFFFFARLKIHCLEAGRRLQQKRYAFAPVLFGSGNPMLLKLCAVEGEQAGGRVGNMELDLTPCPSPKERGEKGGE